VCKPVVNRAGFTDWLPKPGALEAVASLISDITIRFRLEDVLDMPENIIRKVEFPLSPTHRAAYNRLARSTRLVWNDDRVISSVHAAALRMKLLQVASGAVYDNDRIAQRIAS